MSTNRFIGDTEPSTVDFEAVDLNSILAKSPKSTCSSYSDVLAQAHEVAFATDPDSSLTKVCGVLAYLCSLCMPDDDSSAVLVDHGGSPVQLTLAQMATLEAVMPTLANPELQARIADVLWSLKQGKFYLYSSVAVERYLESAKVLESPIDWSGTYGRIHRALRLSLAMNNAADKDKVLAHIEDLISRLDGKDPLYLSVRLHELLLDKGLGDPTKYAYLATTAAQFMPQGGSMQDLRRSHAHWVNASRWHLLSGDADASRTALINAAETYVAEANAYPIDQVARGSLASRAIGDAIEAYRQIPDTSARQEELRKILLDWQAKIRDELTPIVSTRNYSQVVESALSLVEGRTFEEALMALAVQELSPSWSDLRTVAELTAVEQPLLHLIPSELINRHGHVVAKRESIEEDRESALISSMLQDARRRRDFIARAILGPIVNAINTEHYYTEWDLRDYVINKPFVPEKRRRLFLRALVAGLRGDFLQATHYLVNQIENSIRHLLMLQGVITTSLTSERIQHEFTLNTLYDRYEKEIVEILGEDIAYDLKGLLIEQWGSNLRNLTNHGLIDDSEFNSTDSLYLWWLALHLCATFVYVPYAPESDVGDPGVSSVDLSSETSPSTDSASGESQMPSS